MVEAILLGVAQDGGVPQAGCGCATCLAAHTDPARRRHVVSLGLLDHESQQSWLIDATPDFREQFFRLQKAAPGYKLAGILLTHAHMGHYTGLIHLGKEAWNSRQLPVYVTPAMGAFLQQHAPWSQLVTLQNIQLVLLIPDTPCALSDQLRVTPILVPHRNEWSDTVAFQIEGADRTLFYCPDINGWGEWERDLNQLLADVGVALLDGCFFSRDEIAHRDFSQVAHPLVTETVTILNAPQTDVLFIHLNHTNPLLRPGAALKWLENCGYGVAIENQRWAL